MPDHPAGNFKQTPISMFVAGEIEFETAQERAEHGIPLHDSVFKGMRSVAEQVGVAYDLG